MYLSCIIPVLNEAEKISDDIIDLCKYINNNNIKGEIIISDDGSTDKTGDIIKKIQLKNKIPKINYYKNKYFGKGHAIRKGVAKSKGKFVLIIDSGKTVKLDIISKALDIIRKDKFKIILGSRHMDRSKINKQLPWNRRLLSFLFRIFIKLMYSSIREISDTQCGFKIYNGNIARSLINQSKMNGYLFDIEILRLAKKQNIPIKEIPIEWTCDRDSRLSYINVIQEILIYSWRLKLSN